jgi:hypothetical protein
MSGSHNNLDTTLLLQSSSKSNCTTRSNMRCPTRLVIESREHVYYKINLFGRKLRTQNAMCINHAGWLTTMGDSFATTDKIRKLRGSLLPSSILIKIVIKLQGSSWWCRRSLALYYYHFPSVNIMQCIRVHSDRKPMSAVWPMGNGVGWRRMVPGRRTRAYLTSVVLAEIILVRTRDWCTPCLLFLLRGCNSFTHRGSLADLSCFLWFVWQIPHGRLRQGSGLIYGEWADAMWVSFMGQ